MADIKQIKAYLEEYRVKDQLSDLLWCRNIIQAIGIEEFDKLMIEAWRK